MIMKKTLLLAVALLPTLFAGAAAEKKLASITTKDAAGTVTQVKQNFYDATNQLVFAMTSATSYGYTTTTYAYYSYDEQGRLVTDSTQNNQTYYTYDDEGRLVKESKWSYGSEQESTTYVYADGLLDYIQKSDYYGTKIDYTYDADGRLIIEDTYRNDWQTGQPALANRKRYAYDEQGNKVRVTTYTVDADSNETETAHDAFVYNEQNQVVRDTIAGDWSTDAHVYEYDADGDLALVKNSSYSSWSSAWTDGASNFYAYGYYSSDHVVTGISAAAKADDPTCVVLTFTAPADTEGLEGYQLFADGQLLDEVFTATGNTIEVPLQSRGQHSYRMLPVYNGVAANLSESVDYTVEVALNAPQNLRYVNKEWKGMNWQIKVEWDAPEQCGYTLKGYRLVAGGSTNNYTAETTSAEFYDYGWSTSDPGAIRLFAVYEVGESDPVSLIYDPNDHTDEITSHFHADWADVADAQGQKLGRRHLLYVPKYDDYNVGENLLASVDVDNDGNPLYRISPDGNETKKWGEGQWEDYRRVTMQNNERGSRYLTTTSEFVDGEWQVVHEDYIFYDDPESPYNATSYRQVDYKDGQTTIVNFTREEVKEGYTVKQFKDKLTNEAGEFIGTVVTDIRGWDRLNIQRFNAVTRYDAEDNPVSRQTWDYDSDWNLVSETSEVYENGEWKVVDGRCYTYTQSKEYSRTHTPEGNLNVDLDADDNSVITWPAPVRTKEMTGYQIFIDEVCVAEVSADTNEYTFVEEPVSVGAHQARVMALYNGNESCLSEPFDIEIWESSWVPTHIDAALQRAGQVADIFDLSGRKLGTTADGSVTRFAGRVVVLRQSDGTTRKLMLKK